jgi:hypothetical protein
VEGEAALADAELEGGGERRRAVVRAPRRGVLHGEADERQSKSGAARVTENVNGAGHGR